MYYPNKIYELRTAAGLTQIELAAKSDVSITTVGRLEKGLCRLTNESEKKLSDALNVPIEALRCTEATSSYGEK